MNERLQHAFVETELENWNDLFLLHQRFLSHFIFRGQGNSEWKLQTSLERLIERLYSASVDSSMSALYEISMIQEFIWKYPLFEKNILPEKDDYIEWLALMQHFGSPTRMLDFSYSLFVALFMAIEGHTYGKASIWALNSVRLRMKSFEHFQIENNTNVAGGNELDQYIYKRANTAISKNLHSIPLEKELYMVKPNICNERLNRQQGLFVIPSNIQVPFEDNLSELINKEQILSIPISELIDYSNTRSGIYSQSDITLLKINIPKHLNFELTKILRQMNITAETLYPGIEGLAKSMSYLRSAMGDYKN